MHDPNFPTTLLEAVQYFSNPETCERFMVEVRWPGGHITCPICSDDNIARIKSRGLFRCRACQKQLSVKKGTIFEDSALGLDKWLTAVWLITNAKNGISSYEIHRSVGVTQKSAWHMLHRIRTAMQQGTFEKMSGSVEADETYIGGASINMHADKRAEKIHGRGRAKGHKAIVIGLLERHAEKGKSKVRAKVAQSPDKKTLGGNIRENVEAGSELYTDIFTGYNGLTEEYVHQKIDHHEAYAYGAVHTNGMENYWALLKRCLGGTYVSVDHHHLDAYLDEQAFRFNNRKDDDQGRFLAVMQGVDGKRLEYSELIAREEGNGPRRGG